jgi:hypothetical protein
VRNIFVGLAALASWRQEFRCSPNKRPAASGAPAAPLGTTSPTVTPTAFTSVYVYGGSRYFGDDAILDILHDKYHIDVKGEFKKGTFAMADDYEPAKKPVDCIFPGSKIGIEYFKLKHPGVIGNSVVAAQDRIVVLPGGTAARWRQRTWSTADGVSYLRRSAS